MLCVLSVSVHYGLGRHFYFIPAQQQTQVIKWNWIVEPVAIVPLPLAKISVALLLLRLMRPIVHWRKWILCLALALYTVITFLCGLFAIIQCDPPSALWDFQIDNAKCRDPRVEGDLQITTSGYPQFPSLPSWSS